MKASPSTSGNRLSLALESVFAPHACIPSPRHHFAVQCDTAAVNAALSAAAVASTWSCALATGEDAIRSGKLSIFH